MGLLQGWFGVRSAATVADALGLGGPTGLAGRLLLLQLLAARRGAAWRSRAQRAPPSSAVTAATSARDEGLTSPGWQGGKSWPHASASREVAPSKYAGSKPPMGRI